MTCSTGLYREAKMFSSLAPKNVDTIVMSNMNFWSVLAASNELAGELRGPKALFSEGTTINSVIN